MRSVFRLLGRRRVMTTLVTVLGLVAVVLVGMWRAVSPAMILLGVLAVLVIAVAFLAVRLLRANKAADGIEASIRAQSERDLASLAPEREAEVQRLRERFEQSVAALKSSKLAGTGPLKSGKRALYALPWYLMIGPPGAGKTTALLNSGLTFPGGADRVRGLGGTRNCDWFFSNRAVLLDTAGRYTVEDEDREEWTAFLEMLAEHRPERPINGVLVAVPLPDLVGGPAAEVDAHADRVRARIDELTETLGVRAPVYVLFTKADLVQGFTEFFGDLGREQRQQVWGATLDIEEDGSSAHDDTSDGARAAFEREFDTLTEALLPHRNARLARPTGREERRRIYVFPLEMAAARERLARFVAGVFGADAFKEGPAFRGFYLTSGTQEGAPIDRVIGTIAGRFGLPASPVQHAAPTAETKSYFLKDVFTDVVFPDRGMARRSSASVRRGRRAAAASALAAAAVAGLVIAGSVQGAVRSRADLGRVFDLGELASQVEWPGGAAPTRSLEVTEAMRREVERLEGGRPLTQLWLDRGGTVRGPAQDLYYGVVRDMIGVYGLDRLRGALQAAVENPDGPGLQIDLASATADSATAAGTRVRAYDDLKTFLLLTSATERLAEDDDQVYLKGRLADLVVAGAIGVDTTGRGQEAELVERQTTAFVEALARGDAAPFAGEPPLVEQVRRAVYEPPSLEGIYNRIRQQGTYALSRITLADAVPAEHLGLFQSRASVNGFTTRDGWTQFVQPAFRRAAQDPGKDDWVMGRSSEELPANLRDPDVVYAGLERRYNDEYIGAWRRFLRDIEYRPTNGLGGAAGLMTILGSPTDSPLLWLLALVTDETTFEVALTDRASAAASGVLDRVRREVGRRGNRVGRAAREMGDDDDTSVRSLNDVDAAVHPITAAFQGLHALQAPKAPTGEAAPELYKALEGIGQFGRALEAVAADPVMAAEFLGEAEKPGGPVYQTRRDVESATRGLDAEVRQSLFLKPLDVGMVGARGAAAAGQDEQFAEEVAGSFNEVLAGRYPFDPSSDVDAPVGDVAAYFDPTSGVVAQFVQTRLGGRIDGPNVSPQATEFFTKARAIGEALVRGGQASFAFEIQPDVPARTGAAPAADQVYARIHGAESSYRMGSYRPWTRVTWPGEPGALLGLSTRDGSLPSKEYAGDWAVFRMLQAARVRKTGANTYDVAWPFRGEGYTLTTRYSLRTSTSSEVLTDPAGFFRVRFPSSLTP